MPVQIRTIHLRGWVAILVALAVFFAVAIGLAVLAFGIFLFLLPVMVVGSLLYYLLPRPKRPLGETRRGRGEIIDGSYRVLDEPERSQDPPA
jgi:hypothetical protein